MENTTMTRLIVDAALREQLCKAESSVEFCDEAGQILGIFYQTPRVSPAACRSPFSDEEIQRRRQEKGGLPLAEVLKDLGAV
jgi:hypothetical protein